VTPTYSVPEGWNAPSLSRKPMLMVNAFAFAKSATPPPDQWTHFAVLRPVPRRLMIIAWASAIVSGWAFVALLVQSLADGTVLQGSILFLVPIGAFLLFSGAFLVRGLLSRTIRTTWPHIHGIGLGASGVSIRITQGDADIPWEAIQAVEATFTNPNEDNLKARTAIVRVTYIGHEPGRVGDMVKRELPVQVLGASPQVLYWSLVHYWAVVADRDELGSTAAQKRMDDWLERYAENRGTAGLAR